MIIYKTTNTVNGKIYIGKDRKNNPAYLGSGVILSQAVRKYGKDCFRKETIEECLTEKQLDEREKYWIEFYRSCERNLGYNIAKGGTGGDTISNHPRRNEIRHKHSNWMTQNNPTRGVSRSETTIQKWKASYTGKWRGENSPNYGKKRTEESKLKQSKIRKQWWANLSAEEKVIIAEKISRTSIGRVPPPKTEEQKRNHSIWMTNNNPMKGRTHTPEAKEKISLANKGRPKTIEHKSKLSKANLGKTPSNAKIVLVDNVEYIGLQSAANALNISVSTLRYRIKSDASKYEGYKHYERTTK